MIYPITALSDELTSYVRWAPFFDVFAGYQYIRDGQHPDFGQLAISGGLAVGGILLGGWMFLRYEREFATEL